MNFNLLFLLFLLTACGVKGDPSVPRNASTPSVLQNYDDIKIKAPLDEAKKK